MQRFKIGDKVLYGEHLYNSGRSSPCMGVINSLVGNTMYGVIEWYGNTPSGYETRLKDSSVKRVPDEFFNIWVENNGFK